MPVASEEVWRILYAVSRYLLPLLAVFSVLLVLFYILADSHARRESARSLPGSGTIGELVVLSGSRDLDPNTWFPVPREGILGSVRSCDLVIPCPGVHPKHLDFSWEDGLGLLIRPRSGCEALINGIPVNCRTDASAMPLAHGSVLQIGSAVLRLHLFAALDNTVQAPPAQSPAPMHAGPLVPVSASLQETPYPVSAGLQETLYPVSATPAVSPVNSHSGMDSGYATVFSDTEGPDSEPCADRWKEDLGE